MAEAFSLDLAAIESMIEKIRALKRAGAKSAQAVANALTEQIRKDLNAGRAPGGDPWPLRQDGGRPLVNAAAYVRPKAVNNVAYAIVETQHHALHHLGRANGAPERRMLPEQLTPELADAIREAVADELGRLARG